MLGPRPVSAFRDPPLCCRRSPEGTPAAAGAALECGLARFFGPRFSADCCACMQMQCLPRAVVGEREGARGCRAPRRADGLPGGRRGNPPPLTPHGGLYAQARGLLVGGGGEIGGGVT